MVTKNLFAPKHLKGKKSMKIKNVKDLRVITTVNENCQYLEFWPTIAGNWKWYGVDKITCGFITERDEDDDSFKQYSERNQFSEQWGWYSSIYALAKGDVTRFDEVTGYRLTKCLTYLTFEKQKKQIEANELKQQMRR